MNGSLHQANIFSPAVLLTQDQMNGLQFEIQIAEKPSVEKDKTPGFIPLLPRCDDSSLKETLLIKETGKRTFDTIDITKRQKKSKTDKSTNISSIQPSKSIKTSNTNEEQSHRTVYLLQSGNEFHSVNKIDNDNFKLVTDAITTAVNKPSNENNITYDPLTKTKIIYRVLNPEDLNLYDPNERRPPKTTPHRKPAPKRTVKQKIVDDPETNIPQITSVTRSGRCVRPPRRISNRSEYSKVNLEQNEDIDFDLQSSSAENDKSTIIIPLKRRHSCPGCKKVYYSIKRIARHLITFPDHAINSKSNEILEKYKNYDFLKKSHTVDAECQTEQPLIMEKEINKRSRKSLDGNSLKNDKERDERSLFRILVGILQRTSPNLRANMFVRQLAQLIGRLRKLLPSILQESKNSLPCIVSETVGKVLNLSPGEYKFNMDVITCAKSSTETLKHIERSENISHNSTSYENLWTVEGNKKSIAEIGNHAKHCTGTDPVEKWTPVTSKNKWIPIGSNRETLDRNEDDWISSNCNVLVNNQSFIENGKKVNSWNATLHDHHNNKEDNTSGNSWITKTIDELSNIGITRKLTAQNHLLTQTANPTTNDNELTFECKDKIDDLHQDLVFEMNKNIIPIDRITGTGAVCVEETSHTSDFNFSESRFDMQIDSDKLDFASAQYNELKYGRDTLPPFRKIEPKNIQLPVNSLNNITANSNKLHLASDDSILNNDSYPIATESLQLSMDEPHPMNALNAIVDPCKTVTINANETTIHCDDNATLLTDTDLNLPMNVSDDLNRSESMLSVDGTGLDESRLNLSSNQSVLNLLDPLGTDCLSFSDADLNSRSSQMSLDLQLDLFPFHHS